jgi:hypothetical protein
MNELVAASVLVHEAQFGVEGLLVTLETLAVAPLRAGVVFAQRHSVSHVTVL